MSFIEEGLDANSIEEHSRKKKRKNKMRDSDCEAMESNGGIGEVPLENSDAQATKTGRKSNIIKRKNFREEARIFYEEEAANVQELGLEDNVDGMIEMDENKKGLEGAFECDEAGTDHVDSQEDPGSNDDKVRKKNKKKRKKKFLDEADNKEEDANVLDVQELGQEIIDGEKVDRDENKGNLQRDVKYDEEPDTIHMDSQEDPDSDFNNNKFKKHNKRKQLLVKEAAEAGKRGVCYLSRIPPHMDHVKLRHILSQYGEIKRIYLAPEDPTAQVKRKQAGGFRGKEFSEGWVEFAKKSAAKRVADMLNGEQIGGRKRSSYYYDLWNIKYLSKFKWEDLTEETANKTAIGKQKLTLELSAAKRERDFYLAKVDHSRALASIEERLKKKQKRLEVSATEPGNSPGPQPSKVIRVFPQKHPVAKDAAQAKPRLSKEMLAGVFGAT